MKEKLLQLKFEVRALLAREPSLAWLQRPIIWWTQHKMRGHIDIRECRVGPHTEFVLDGFQGSGNSFATVAFKKSQSRPVRIAHHLHAPAQIIKAVQRELPTLVTIREPAGAVVSLGSRWPYVSMQQALRSYIRFYEKIEPYAAGFVLSTFDQTINHLDEVIEAVNHRFGQRYDIFYPTDANMAAVRDNTELDAREEVERKALKAEKAKELDQDPYQPLLAEARAVYERMRPLGVNETA